MRMTGTITPDRARLSRRDRLSAAVSGLVVALVWSTAFSAHAQLVIAHRGASYDAPENTLAAFRLAWEKGADGIEGDFYLTKDRRIVCIHDAGTGRTAGVELDVADSTLAELRKLDVGRYRGEQFAGERIPLIEDVLATVPAGKKIFIEVKCGPEIVPYLREVLARSKLQPEQTCVISFDKEVVAASKRQIPRVKAYWLTGFRENPDTGSWEPSLEEVLRTAEETRADGVDLNAQRQVVDAGFVKRLRGAGLEFHCWTVNDPAVAGCFQLLGVDSITTDRPDYIRQNLLTAGLWEHLQVHLRLDGDLEDTSGHGRHGTVAAAKGAGAVFCEAVFGQGLDLSARGAAVAVRYRLPEAGAVSLWYYARDWYNYQTVLDNAVGPDDWEMWIYETGQIRFRTHHKGKARIVHQLHPTGDVNEWHHFVVTWDRRDRSRQAVRLYVNGRLAASSDWQGSPWLEPGATFYLAGGNGNTKGNGVWDDVAVFDVALQPGDVQRIMDFGAGSLRPADVVAQKRRR